MKTFLFKRKTLNLTLAIMLLTLTLAGTAFSQALTISSNEFIPFAQAVFVPCANGGAGEIVLLEGTLHLQGHTTIIDGRAIFESHAQQQGVVGVGQVTGDIYHSAGVSQRVDSIPLINNAFEFTFIIRSRLIGPGPDNNLQVDQIVHVTADANGNVSAVVDNRSIECN